MADIASMKKCQLLSNGWTLTWNWEWRRDNHFIHELIDEPLCRRQSRRLPWVDVNRLPAATRFDKVHESERFRKRIDVIIVVANYGC